MLSFRNKENAYFFSPKCKLEGMWIIWFRILLLLLLLLHPSINLVLYNDALQKQEGVWISWSKWKKNIIQFIISNIVLHLKIFRSTYMLSICYHSFNNHLLRQSDFKLVLFQCSTKKFHSHSLIIIVTQIFKHLCPIGDLVNAAIFCFLCKFNAKMIFPSDYFCNNC